MLAASSRERRRLPRKEGFHARGAHWTWVWPCRIDREKKRGGDIINLEKKNTTKKITFQLFQLLCLSSKFLLCAYVVLIMFNL